MQIRFAYYTAMISKMEVNRSCFIDIALMCFIDLTSGCSKLRPALATMPLEKELCRIYFFQTRLFYHARPAFSMKKTK
jgi:hypothetical protein